MNYSNEAYYRDPIGKQLLRHMANRNAVRHATPLLPFSFSELVSWFRHLGARPENKGSSNKTVGAN